MLTGTPLQNDLGELQNLLAFLLPDLFQAEAAVQPGDVQVGAAIVVFSRRGDRAHIRLSGVHAMQSSACQWTCRGWAVFIR
jgi:hypothetical protein